MLTASQSTINALTQSQSFSMSNGCWIEYNMNSLIDGASITAPDGVITITHTKDGIEYKPFEKLFPITSIIDPRRPKVAGIKYFILGDPSLSKDVASGVIKNYNTSANFPSRLYYSGSKIAYKYWVTPPATGTSLSNCILSLTYPATKTAVTNKITIKFETSHSKPTSWTVKLTPINGSESTIYTGTTVPDNGVVNLYYNGTSWSTTEFTNPSTGINFSGLNLQISSIDQSGGYAGIIEIAPKYVIDVSSRVLSFATSKNSSDSTTGIVPVGDVTANSLNLSLNAYDKNYEYYDKTNPFNKDKINLYKDTIIYPFIIIESEKIKLGVFYTESFSVSEFGDVSITALDGAKELQYIKPPDLVTSDMSSVAIIRRLLDSIGFTNYNFNLPSNDTASITPFHWYTDNTKTVWDHIKDLCKDTQMIAVFDENDILQFYPRDYIFVDKTTQFKLRDRNIGSNLANISSLGIENVPSIKSVKVMYSPQLSSAYLASAENLYDAPVITLGASALIESLPANATKSPLETDSDGVTAPLGTVSLEPVVSSGIGSQLYSYKGYLVIQKEIIEYDAIEYSYVSINPADNGAIKTKWMTSDADISKYQGLAKPNTFKPTAKYRIKTRNVFNVLGPVTSSYTQVMLDADMTHNIDTDSIATDWTGKLWNSTAGTFVDSSSIFTMQSIPAFNPDNVTVSSNEKYLFNGISKSMMTLFAKNVESKPDSNDPGITIYTPNTNYAMATINADYLAPDVSNFIIGTNMYFPLTVDPNTKKPTGNQMTVAGLAFSLSEDNKSGYLITIGTSQNSNGDKSYKDVNFYKIVNGKPIPMITSQKDTDGSIITNINGGQLYKVDIKANKTTKDNATYLTFKVILNGKTFGVSDSAPITLTNKIGLLSLQGISSFDYVYSSSIDDAEFISGETFDAYQGFLSSNSTLVKNFSDFLFQKGDQASRKVWVREFGPVARELKRIQSRYTNAPGFPRYTQIVQNPQVSLVGSSLDPFTLDVFVMNNTGAFTELANGQEKSFIVVGDQVIPSDPFEYMDPNLTDIQKAEQIGFDSIWIQKESEAKALSDWITKQWAHQQKVLTIDTLLNPLLQIGDIIEVSYPANNLYSSEDANPPSAYPVNKYVILSLDSTYDNGSAPVTTVVCRSIYS